MIGTLVNSRKMSIFATFFPYKKNPFQFGPSIKIAKKHGFQHFVQEPDGFITCELDSAIYHIIIDLILGCWNFLFKIVGGGAGESDLFFDLCGLMLVAYEMYSVLRTPISICGNFFRLPTLMN